MQHSHHIIILTRGDGPYECEYEDCLHPGVLVNLMEPVNWPGSADIGIVHHKDEDHWNDDPANLAVMHHACHSSHHGKINGWPQEAHDAALAVNTGRIKSNDERAKISIALTGVAKSEEHRAKIGDIHRGKTISQEQRDDNSRRMTGVPKSDEHKQKIREAVTAAWARRKSTQ